VQLWRRRFGSLSRAHQQHIFLLRTSVSYPPPESDAMPPWTGCPSPPYPHEIGRFPLEPSTSGIAIGIAFHQWADISWALVFFGVLGKMDRPAQPRFACRCKRLPWAGPDPRRSNGSFWCRCSLLAADLSLLQQPYWIGFLGPSIHQRPCTLCSPGFVRSASERKRIQRKEHFSGIWCSGAFVRDRHSGGQPRCSPPTIANFPGPARTPIDRSGAFYPAHVDPS